MGKKRGATGKDKAELPSWPDRVQALLQRYQLTQKQLGSRLGLSPQNVNDFVNARRIPPMPVQKLLTMMENGDDLSSLEENNS